ncbi:MAG: AraC family transcriptional regulator [Candidatus Tectimicrobiota bacterium]
MEPTVDVLSDILNVIKMQSTLSFRTAFWSPWGVDVPASPLVARFHAIIQGECWLRLSTCPTPLLLQRGDVAVVPHGEAHLLSDTPSASVRPEPEHQVAARGFCGAHTLAPDGLTPTTAPTTSMVCGYFRFDADVLHPLLGALPATIHIQSGASHNHLWLAPLLGFLDAEAGSGHPGSEAIVQRVSEILFIQVIRAYLHTAGDQARCLAAIADPSIGRALQAIHRQPGLSWTLASLAKEAGLSRTRFATRFAQLMQLTPLQYVTRWRMHKAKQLLRDTPSSLFDIAEQVGYHSEAAFSRVFKKHFHIGPGSYRRHSH